MINPAKLMKLKHAKEAFYGNHPKFAAFLAHMFQNGMEEGTVIEITVTKPGGTPVTSNMRVQQTDLELLNSLREIGS